MGGLTAGFLVTLQAKLRTPGTSNCALEGRPVMPLPGSLKEGNALGDE